MRGQRAGGAARRWGVTLAVAGIGILLTACGSSGRPGQPAISVLSTSMSTSSSPPENDPLETSGPATPTSPTDTSSAAASYSPIGSFTVTSPGARVTTSFEVGQPLIGSTGTPPADVMASCGWDTIAGQSVFIPGRLTVLYTGNIAEAVSIPGPSLVDLPATLQGSDAALADVAIQGPDGSWKNCHGDTAHPWGYILQPGDTLTAAFWIADQALSNTHPYFSTTDQNELGVRFRAIGSDQVVGPDIQVAVAGPGAANCSDGVGDEIPTLLLYSTAPYRYSATVAGESRQGACRKP